MGFAGSGLRSRRLSPSTRREWIEIGQMTPVQVPSVVSLHTEGVD